MLKLLDDTLKTFCKKAFTEKYPKEKIKLPKGFRGSIKHDARKCSYCGLCARFCPTGAIRVIPGKCWEYDASKCIFCGQCVDICRDVVKKNALEQIEEMRSEIVNLKGCIVIHNKIKPLEKNQGGEKVDSKEIGNDRKDEKNGS